MRPKASRVIFDILGIILFLALVTQLQPVFLDALGALNGTFGLRPTSHRCVGLSVSADWVTGALPSADWQGTFGLFRVRYFVPREAGGGGFCLGQDVWFGE
jgi:hypothetical protein